MNKWWLKCFEQDGFLKDSDEFSPVDIVDIPKKERRRPLKKWKRYSEAIRDENLNDEQYQHEKSNGVGIPPKKKKIKSRDLSKHYEDMFPNMFEAFETKQGEQQNLPGMETEKKTTEQNKAVERAANIPEKAPKENKKYKRLEVGKKAEEKPTEKKKDDIDPKVKLVYNKIVEHIQQNGATYDTYVADAIQEIKKRNLYGLSTVVDKKGNIWGYGRTASHFVTTQKFIRRIITFLVASEILFPDSYNKIFEQATSIKSKLNKNLEQPKKESIGEKTKKKWKRFTLQDDVELELSLTNTYFEILGSEFVKNQAYNISSLLANSKFSDLKDVKSIVREAGKTAFNIQNKKLFNLKGESLVNGLVNKFLYESRIFDSRNVQKISDFLVNQQIPKIEKSNYDKEMEKGEMRKMAKQIGPASKDLIKYLTFFAIDNLVSGEKEVQEAGK
jgi:hypothetical protein